MFDFMRRKTKPIILNALVVGKFLRCPASGGLNSDMNHIKCTMQFRTWTQKFLKKINENFCVQVPMRKFVSNRRKKKHAGSDSQFLKS